MKTIKENLDFKTTSIGKIPKDWGIVSIGDVADTSSGGTPNRSKKEYFNGNIYWVKSGELEDNVICETEEKITDEGLKCSSAKMLSKGTFLIALYGATVGKTGILGIDASTNQAICAIIPKNDRLDINFLQQYMVFNRPKLIAVSSGGAQPNLSQEIVQNFKILLPPFPEQQKIAEVLTTVDGAIEKVGQKIEKISRIKKGLMRGLLIGKLKVIESKESKESLKSQESQKKSIESKEVESQGRSEESISLRVRESKEFKDSELGKIPKDWELVSIGDRANTSSGGTPSRGKKEYFNGNICWVKSGELEDNVIFETEEKITDEGLKCSSAKMLPKGTFLIALYGATVGKTAILGIDASTNQAICAIIPKNDSLDVNFLQQYMVFNRPKLIAVSSGGAQPNLSQEIVQNFKILLPVFPEQQKIAGILMGLDKKLEQERNRKEKLERVKKGLMEVLLTGKKRIRSL